MLFEIPPFLSVMYNDNQIMMIVDKNCDPGWNDINITYGKTDTLSVYMGKKEIGIIANKKLTPMIMACSDFYIGWVDKNGILSQRKIIVDTNSLYPL